LCEIERTRESESKRERVRERVGGRERGKEGEGGRQRHTFWPTHRDLSAWESLMMQRLVVGERGRERESVCECVCESERKGKREGEMEREREKKGGMGDRGRSSVPNIVTSP